MNRADLDSAAGMLRDHSDDLERDSRSVLRTDDEADALRRQSVRARNLAEQIRALQADDV